MKDKILFIDIDGTLVDYSTKLPDSAATAIIEARKEGAKALICTGRSKAEIYPYIWNIGFDGVIAANGAYVEYENETISHHTIPEDKLKKIYKWLKDNKLGFYIETNHGLYANEEFKTKGREAIRKFFRRKNHDSADSFEIKDVFPDMIFDIDLEQFTDINKISFVVDNYENLLEARDQFSELHVGSWFGHSEDALFGDFALEGISKGKGIKDLLKELDDDFISYSFGDEVADIPMFEVTDYSICMRDGHNLAKEKADYVAQKVEEDGLYHIFKDLELIK